MLRSLVRHTLHCQGRRSLKPDYPNLTGCRQELAVLGRHILANIALGAFFARLVNDLSRSRSGLAAGMLAHEYN